ncbi:MAG: glycosyltransferase family 9 protein [Magnetococcales bacterium]|nr:glycosyltransferase family 9 protein [Magnetococcales bacterium]
MMSVEIKPYTSRKDKSDPRILIIRLSALGDLIECTRYIHGFRRYWPQGRFELLTSRLGHKLYAESPLFEAIHIWPRKESLRRRLKAIRAVREHEFDYIFDLHGNKSSGWLTTMMHTHNVGRIGAGPLHKTFIGRYRKNPRTVTQMLKQVGIRIPEARVAELDACRPELLVSEEAQEAVRARLSTGGLALDRPMILLAPGSSEKWPSKRWSADRFRQLAKGLIEQGYSVVLVGTEEEMALGEIISQGCDKLLDWIGMTELSELVALASLAQGCVANDSGPMHVAAAVGTPTLGLFGPTMAERHGPEEIHGPSHRSLSFKVACSPCYEGRCPKPSLFCLEGIEVAEVLRAIVEMVVRR